MEFWGHRWIVYRCQNSLQSASWIALSQLDRQYRVKWTVKLKTQHHTAEDPRAVVQDGKLFIFYQTGATHWPKISAGDWTIRCLCFDMASLRAEYDRPLTWEGRRPCEKNWCPFWYPPRKKWYCVYSVKPWMVLEFDEEWQGMALRVSHPRVEWVWGEVRGGSCPRLVMPPSGRFTFGDGLPQYFAWFHSRYEPAKCTRRPPQYVGALMSFSAEYPFPMTGISARPVLWPDPARKSEVAAHVAYPAGAILENGLWTVSYGHGDRECCIAECLHEELTDGRNWVRI